MSRKLCILFTIWILILATSACNVQTGSTQPSGELPLTEAEIPRVTVEEAKAALDSGEAIIVDVRGSDAYETSHIAGAINIPLGEFETNSEGLKLAKDQWIITYCTWPDEHTSARAAFILSHNGYSRATPVLGGFEAWIEAGYPVEP